MFFESGIIGSKYGKYIIGMNDMGLQALWYRKIIVPFYSFFFVKVLG